MTTLREAAILALEVMSDISSFERWSEVRDALKAALAEPVQEPVAYVDQRIHGWPDCFVMEAAPPHTTPLYTAPPRRKPLTDEEIRDLWSWSMTAEAERTASTQQHAFARAIERAHGIGGTNESA